MLFIVLGLLVALGLVALARAYFAQQSGYVVPPKWAVGDEWTWHNSDGPNVSFHVTGVQPDSYQVQVRARAHTSTIRVPLDLSLSNADWFRFQWPLTPGRTWTYEVVGVVNGRNTTWQGTAHAVDLESVTVPAGTFQAVRIDGRHCNLTQGGCGGFTLWYAPKAKYVVKLVVANTPYWVPSVRGFQQELVSYQVH
jgi:hypothetical protein